MFELGQIFEKTSNCLLKYNVYIILAFVWLTLI